MRFDLTDLRLFTAIVEAGSITRGAEAANMALAAASARVTGMEADLGTALLDRHRHGVTPTPAGLTLLHHARQVTAQIQRMRGELHAYAAGLKAEVRMQSNTAALVHLLPAALRVFLADHPAVDVHVEERTSAEIVLAVAAGQCSFGLIASSADPGHLQTIRLTPDRLTAITASTHPLAGRQQISFAELLEEPFVGLAAGALHDHLAHHAARLGHRLAYRVRLQSFDAVVRLVAAGIGVAILPLPAVQRHSDPEIAAIPLADNWANRRLLACALDFSRLTTPARLLIDELRRQSALA